MDGNFFQGQYIIRIFFSSCVLFMHFLCFVYFFHCLDFGPNPAPEFNTSPNKFCPNAESGFPFVRHMEHKRTRPPSSESSGGVKGSGNQPLHHRHQFQPVRRGPRLRERYRPQKQVLWCSVVHCGQTGARPNLDPDFVVRPTLLCGCVGAGQGWNLRRGWPHSGGGDCCCWVGPRPRHVGANSAGQPEPRNPKKGLFRANLRPRYQAPPPSHGHRQATQGISLVWGPPNLRSSGCCVSFCVHRNEYLLYNMCEVLTTGLTCNSNVASCSVCVWISYMRIRAQGFVKFYFCPFRGQARFIQTQLVRTQVRLGGKPPQILNPPRDLIWRPNEPPAPSGKCQQGPLERQEEGGGNPTILGLPFCDSFCPKTMMPALKNGEIQAK